jgi:hypothetical protein
MDAREADGAEGQDYLAFPVRHSSRNSGILADTRKHITPAKGRRSRANILQCQVTLRRDSRSMARPVNFQQRMRSRRTRHDSAVPQADRT